MRVHDARLRVRYAETDQMGIVYYANYLIWMEIGRVEYCRQAGFDYAGMEAGDGVLLTVVDAQCRYRHPARYDDQVVVRTSIAKASPRMIVFRYLILRQPDGKPLAEGETRHVFCGRDLKPTRLPSKYFRYLGIQDREPAPASL